MSETGKKHGIKDNVKTKKDVRAKHSPIILKKVLADTVAGKVKSANGMTNFSGEVNSENEDEFVCHSGRTYFDHVNDEERSNKNEDSMTDPDGQCYHKNESNDRSYYMSDNKSECHNVLNSKAFSGSKTVISTSHQSREACSKLPTNFVDAKNQDENHNEDHLEVDTHAIDLSVPSHHSEDPTLSEPCIAQDRGKANTVDKDMNAAHSCSLCGSGFSTKLLLDTHIQNQHPEDFTPVLHENTNALDLRKSCEKTTASDEKPFKCQECGIGFNVNFNLQKHMRIHTGDVPYNCNECGKTFTDFNKYHGHMKRHMGEKPFTCHLCQKTFNKKSKLLKHVRVHTGEKPFKCNECGRGFSESSAVYKHMRIHTGEKPFCCNECDKKFSESSSLHKHTRTHTLEKPFICFECGKSFSESSSLHKHIKIHTGEKPFVCKICGKSFSVGGKLQEHQRTHTGEKPYKCNECGRTFSYNHCLRRHMRTHTGEKPFTCTECGRCFGASSTLHKHIKIHTGEKAFKCSVCGKDFTHSNCLHRHMRTHTGEKPFKCTECGKCFSDNSHLHRHVRTHSRPKISHKGSVHPKHSQTPGTVQISGTPEVYRPQSLFRISLHESSGISTSPEDYGCLPIYGTSKIFELAQMSKNTCGSPNNFDV